MLRIEDTFLVLIDIQGKLWNAMYEKEGLLENTLKLVRGVNLLGIPSVLTEQNPAGLGPTLPDLAQLMPETKPLAKFCFSCYQDQGFHNSIVSLERKQALVCGIEAHICVYQTALELLNNGYEVQVVADAVSSRAVRNREIALNRMQNEGARLTTVEMALFELLQTAQSPKFKELSRIIR